MRLIDADKIKGVFDVNTWQGDMLISVIDNTETAYDLDKVVEKIEETKCSKEGADREVGCHMRNVHVDMCIEIVREGGVE